MVFGRLSGCLLILFYPLPRNGRSAGRSDRRQSLRPGHLREHEPDDRPGTEAVAGEGAGRISPGTSSTGEITGTPSAHRSGPAAPAADDLRVLKAREVSILATDAGTVGQAEASKTSSRHGVQTDRSLRSRRIQRIRPSSDVRKSRPPPFPASGRTYGAVFL